MSHRVAAFEIGCPDRAVCEAFYASVFGWTFSPVNPFASAVGGAEPGPPGHLTSLGHEPHSYVMVYLETDEVGATLEKVKAAGGEALVGPLPTGTGRTFAWFRDVAGNTLGLLGPG